ncbi:hypothetical protein O9993_11305 [Vibrio lentus]|nr:hypothetical protein [Vibrio lentus]
MRFQKANTLPIKRRKVKVDSLSCSTKPIRIQRALQGVSVHLDQSHKILYAQVEVLNVNCESQASAAEEMSHQLHQMTQGIEESIHLWVN